MKIIFTSPNGQLTVEAEPKTIKDSFEAIGQINEFLIPGPCGCCKGINTYPNAKHTKEYVFFEHVCRDCGAAFSFGQAKEGGRLFPKRNDKDGKPLMNRGWSVYQGNGQHAAPQSQEPNREPQAYSQEEEVPF